MQRLALSLVVIVLASCGSGAGGPDANPATVPNGGACAGDDVCVSGICNDEGVCCDAPCDGACQTCTTGTCTLPPAAATEDCGMDCSRHDAGCVFYDNPANQCAALGVCKDDTDIASCEPRDGQDDEACGSGCQWCQAGACVDIPADTDPLDECGECQVCDGAGACRAAADGTDPEDECTASECTRDACLGGTCRLEDGTACGAGCSRCTNGSCDAVPATNNADPNGVCGPCQVCDGADGCRAADDGTDPKDECTAGGDGCEYASCTAGSCFAPATTVCGAASCDGTLQIDPFECDGTGACAPAGTTPCAPNLCGAAGCETSCAGDLDCQGGHTCQGMACVRSETNIIFVTSTTHQAAVDFTDLATADAICNQRAAAAGLTGTYRAWLSDDSTHAIDRLGTARGWVRPDRLPFADTRAELVAGQVFYPPRLDEHGRGHDTVVQTATNADGTGDGQHCSSWSQTTGALSGGLSFATTRGWTTDVATSCGGPRSLLCLGIDYAADVTPAPVAGRRAFVSAAGFTPSSGLAAADAICAGEASSAGLTGTFRALLPPGTNASARARFDVGGARWVRTDGVPIVETAAGISAVPLLTGVAVHADGTTYFGGRVRTGPGSVDLAGGTSSCGGWTTDTGSTATGRSYLTSGGWFSADTGVSCAEAYPIYCFEQ